MPRILRRMIHGFADYLHHNGGRVPYTHGRFVQTLYRLSCTPKCKTILLLGDNCPECLKWGEKLKSEGIVWQHKCPIRGRQITIYGQEECPVCGKPVIDKMLADVFRRMTTD